MTISSKVSSATLNGNGVATAFPFNFVVWDDTQLAVYITGTDGTTAEVSNWTVARTETGGVVTYPAVGGTVLPVGASITILRDMPFTQEVDLVTGVAFKPEVVETSLDQVVASLQQVKEAVDRAVSIPVGSPVSPTDYLAIVGGYKDSAESASASAEAASVAAVAARAAADADVLLTHADAETASAGAAIITANLTAINNVTANLPLIQDAPANATAAATGAETASTKASEANASALAAAQSASEAAAAASGGALNVSTDDTTLGYLETKLLAGDGLAASTQNAGGAETRSLSVALAASSGLGFEAGLLRVQAGAGLAVSPLGLAADVGTTAGKLVQLGEGGALPAVSGANLTNLPGGGSQIKSISASVASSALTLGLAATALDFRSATLTDGAPTAISVGALSLVVPSGATLGTVNGIASRLALLVAYNAGTPVLCVVNLAGGLRLDESALISPTTISDAADAANVIYSASSVAANSPYRVVGFLDISEVTAGTWATGPTLVQGQGGAASVGQRQAKWQAVTRVLGVTYYNTTGDTIYGNYVTSATNAHTASITINGITLDGSSYTNTGPSTAVSAEIPAGASYVISDSGVTPSIARAFELR